MHQKGSETTLSVKNHSINCCKNNVFVSYYMEKSYLCNPNPKITSYQNINHFKCIKFQIS
jgi:hypothetical protein